MPEVLEEPFSKLKAESNLRHFRLIPHESSVRKAILKSAPSHSKAFDVSMQRTMLRSMVLQNKDAKQAAWVPQSGLF
jgi:hypothetical protein